jgi:DNA polymerase-3 subunit gamma/tau
MSYQVIARKYRPQAFQDLIGQNHISQTLINALKAGRFPQALLFCGTRGVGKTSAARILAKTLLCKNMQDFKPCQTCSSCTDISSGAHMDVIEIDGASNNGVDAIRELRETVGYMPGQGKYKIYIIDEVHMLSTSAFNALLKTLEEPPAHVIFILATTEPQKIPITILSRCQRFDFKRISTRLIQSHLEALCKKENVKFESEALWLVARLADGSMRDGLSLLDQVINFANADLSFDKVSDVLGVTDRNLLMDTLQGLIERDTAKMIAIVERIFSAGQDPVVFCQNLLESIRHLLFIKLAEKPTELLDLSDGEIEALKKLVHPVSQEDIHLLFDMCLKGAQDLIRSQNPRVVLEMLLMRMAQAPRIEDMDTFFAGGEVASSKPLSKPATTHAAPKAAPVAPAPAVSTFDKNLSLEANWTAFVERAKKASPILGAQLEHAALAAFESDKIVLGVAEDDKFFLDQLRESKQQQKLKELLLQFWQVSVSVSVQAQAREQVISPQTAKKQKENKNAEELKTKVEGHPLIQNLQKNFSGKITDIKGL